MAKHESPRLGCKANLICDGLIGADIAVRVLGPAAFAGRTNILRPFWELSKVPPRFATSLSRFQEIWAPSEFVRAAFAQAVDVPVLRMPVPVELGEIAPVSRATYGLPEKATLILFAFDPWTGAREPDPVGKTALITGISGQDGAYLARAHILRPQRRRGAVRQRPNAEGQQVLVPRRAFRQCTAATPDLVKVFDSTELKDPALLCHYFFFPAHEEALASCTNIEAKEFGSFAGEWACMALLLGQDGADKPSFIGQTGRLLSPIPGVSLPPQTDDGQDAARRVVMKVNKFVDSALIDGHPTLFVANGTHSLYLQSGTIAVTYPADSRPFSCGRAEAPPPPNEPSPSQHGGAIFYAKLLLAIQFVAMVRVPIAVAIIMLEGPRLALEVSIAISQPRK
jgi:hypothetical protein